MRKLLRHGRNSKPSFSSGGDVDINEILSKIKDSFIEAGFPDAGCFGNNNNNVYYPDEPLGIDTECDYPNFYWFNHPSGFEYQHLLAECRFRAGYISDSDFIKHLSVNVFLVDGDVNNNNITVSVGTDEDIQYVRLSIPMKITNELGSDCFISLYYDDVEIIFYGGALHSYIAD